MPHRAAIYARVSTVDQKVDAQEVELRSYFERRGWTVAEEAIFRDTMSGSATSRPDWDKLMQAVRCGKVDCIVVYKLDRIGRSLVHLALILDEFARLHVPLICTSQGIDTSEDNPIGRLQLGVLMAVAEFERSLIRERTKAGLAAARARGAKIGRPDRTAIFREEIRRMRGEGASYRRIGQRLGIAASSACRFCRFEGIQHPAPEETRSNRWGTDSAASGPSETAIKANHAP